MATRKTRALPKFIEPMLAEPGAPFDAADYLFEIKWDGTRTLAFIDADTYRLVNRRKLEMTERYPELDFIRKLPPGTVLDGEIAVLKDGKPDFPLLMQREQAQRALRIKALARNLPAIYLVFDLLYDDYESVMNRSLSERRERLRELVRQVGEPRLVVSEGVVGQGKAFFQKAVEQELEGVVGKRLSSKYLPGKRTDAWIKVKRSSTYHCAVIGFVPDGPKDFRSLILAMDEGDGLRFCGKVGSGLTNKMRAHLNQVLWSRLRPKPLVPCKIKGKWVEPGLYCRVSCMEKTENGELRAPVFEGLEGEPATG